MNKKDKSIVNDIIEKLKNNENDKLHLNLINLKKELNIKKKEFEAENKNLSLNIEAHNLYLKNIYEKPLDENKRLNFTYPTGEINLTQLENIKYEVDYDDLKEVLQKHNLNIEDYVKIKKTIIKRIVVKTN